MAARKKAAAPEAPAPEQPAQEREQAPPPAPKPADPPVDESPQAKYQRYLANQAKAREAHAERLKSDPEYAVRDAERRAKIILARARSEAARIVEDALAKIR